MNKTYYGHKHTFTNRTDDPIIHFNAGADERLTLNAHAVHILSTEDAVNTSTGSLITAGGVGIQKSVYAGGLITTLGNFTGTNMDLSLTGGVSFRPTTAVNALELTNLNTVNSTSIASGSLVFPSLTLNGAKDVYVGDNTVTSSSTITQWAHNDGGLSSAITGVGGTTYMVGTSSFLASTFRKGLTNAKDSRFSDTSTGYSLRINGATNATDTSTGALMVAGGMGIARDLSCRVLDVGFGSINGNVTGDAVPFRHIWQGTIAFTNTDLREFASSSMGFADTHGVMTTGTYQIFWGFSAYSELTLDKYFDFMIYYNGVQRIKKTVHTALLEQVRFGSMSYVFTGDPSLITYHTQSLTYNDQTVAGFHGGICIYKMYN